MACEETRECEACSKLRIVNRNLSKDKQDTVMR